MGACATKSGDLKKVKGEPPVVEEDAAVPPPVAEGEKANTVEEVVPAAAETDPADVSRRRSLSDLLKEDAEASDGEAGQEAVKVVTEESVVVTGEAEAPASLSKEAQVDKELEVAVAPSPLAVEADVDKALEVAVEPSVADAVKQDTAEAEADEQLAEDDPKAAQEPGGEAQSAEEEKRVDPDSVQVAKECEVVADGASAQEPEVAALSAEGGEVVADGASA